MTLLEDADLDLDDLEEETYEVVRSAVLGPPEPFQPLVLGPIWTPDPDGEFEYVLPKKSLGWACMLWANRWLKAADGEGGGWTFTPEQMRVLLWFYAVDERGRWLYRDTILQMVKGWGKDPFAAVLCAIELLGPCRFGGWDGDGNPIAVPLKKEPWVQIIGTAQEQTVNTMLYLHGLFKPEAIAKYGIEINQTIIYALSRTARIEAKTSSFRSMEGNRPSFLVRNEPQHWLRTNEGYEVNKAAMRNINKMRSPKQKRAHTLTINNAYDPAEESVGQWLRESYEIEAAEGDPRTLYYSLEAPETIPLLPDYTRLDEAGNRVQDFDKNDVMIPPDKATIVQHLTYVLERLRGDAEWLDAEETAEEILKPEQDLSEMRRFYLNSVVTGDDEYLADGDLRATIHELLVDVRAGRERSRDSVLRAGWALVGREEPVVLFFDGSKSDDSTAIVGCRVSDGYFFLVGLWEQPKGNRSRTKRVWLAPREEISARVAEAFDTFNVVAFWADPSHTKDDKDGTRYWDGVIDDWHELYSERLQHWAAKGGANEHSIMWDMASPANSATFSKHVVSFADVMDAHAVTWDGHPGLRSHLRAARKAWTSHGAAIRKPARGGYRKIDAAVCAIGAYMLARIVRVKGLEEVESAGTLWIPPSMLRRR